MAAAEPFLRIENISKSFGTFQAVRDVSLDVQKGEIFSLLGGSGCGKTTLLRMLAGFEEPSGGKIYLDGRDMTGVAPWDRPVHMMFQSFDANHDGLLDQGELRRAFASLVGRRRAAAAQVRTRPAIASDLARPRRAAGHGSVDAGHAQRDQLPRQLLGVLGRDGRAQHDRFGQQRGAAHSPDAEEDFTALPGINDADDQHLYPGGGQRRGAMHGRTLACQPLHPVGCKVVHADRPACLQQTRRHGPAHVADTDDADPTGGAHD